MLIIIGIILAGIWFYKWLNANANYFEKKGIKYTKQDITAFVKSMTARDKSIADLVQQMYNDATEKYEFCNKKLNICNMFHWK